MAGYHGGNSDAEAGIEAHRKRLVGNKNKKKTYEQAYDEGAEKGKKRAEGYYGDQEGIRRDTEKVSKNVMDMLSGNDAATSRLKASNSSQQRSLRDMQGQNNIGGSQGMMQRLQLQRSGDMAIHQAVSSNQQSRAELAGRLVGNKIAGTESMIMGEAAQQSAHLATKAPKSQKSSGGGTVICTELHRQGYMSDELYEKDQAYGQLMIDCFPHIYNGYIYIATPIVSLMKKSRMFTKVVSLFALPWAREIGGDENIIGSFVNYFGSGLCSIIGKQINRRIKNG